MLIVYLGGNFKEANAVSARLHSGPKVGTQTIYSRVRFVTFSAYYSSANTIQKRAYSRVYTHNTITSTHTIKSVQK